MISLSGASCWALLREWPARYDMVGACLLDYLIKLIVMGENGEAPNVFYVMRWLLLTDDDAYGVGCFSFVSQGRVRDAGEWGESGYESGSRYQ